MRTCLNSPLRMPNCEPAWRRLKGARWKRSSTQQNSGMSGPQHSASGNTTGLHSDAYAFQQGEFYPEHHQANVQRLHQKYPEFPLSEIDAVYRQACRIDSEVQERVDGAQLSQQAREELLDWLGDHFYGFSTESFLRAIERAESR